MRWTAVNACLVISALLVAAGGAAAEEQLYFPQFGSGAGLASDIVLTNPSPRNRVAGRVDFYDDSGNPLFVKLAGVENGNPVSGAGYSIPPLGSLTLQTLAQVDLKEGSAVTTSDGPLGGVIRFLIPGLGVAGVGASLPASAFVIPARSVPDSIGIGLAVYNPALQAVDLNLTLRDTAARTLAARVIRNFPPRGHLAAYVAELLEEAVPAEYEGTLTVEVVGGNVAAMALELGSQPGEFTALPVTALATAPPVADQRLYFAQFGNGGGMRSAIVLVNPHVGEAVSGKVEFYDDSGLPLAVGMTDPAGTSSAPAREISSVDFTLPALGAATFGTDGAGSLVVGSARILAGGTLGAVIRYEIEGYGTTAVPQSLPGAGALVPVRIEPGGINTGIALQNVGENSLELDLILRDSQGKQIPGGQSRIVGTDLPPRGHTARFINQLFPHARLEEFTGTVSVESRQGSFAVSSLEMGSVGGEFTTLPVTPLQGRTRRADSVGAFDVTSGYVVLSLDNAPDGARRRFHFAESHPSSSLISPVAGDFDGDGEDTMGFFNYREARFYLANSNLPAAIDRVIDFVPPGHNPTGDGRGWIPLAGDWTGAGYDQLALYEWHTSSFYFLDAQGNLVSTMQTGVPRPTPIADSWPGGPYPFAGDWDGDGIDTVGICYLGENGKPNLFHLKNNFLKGSQDLAVEFGAVHGYPLAGDWDGDGADTIGLFDPITKTAYLKNSNQSGDPDHSFIMNEGPLFECLVCNRLPGFTIPGVFPMAGRWDTRGDASPSSGYPWPTDTPDNHGLDPAKLAVAADQGGKLGHLRSLLVVRNGQLVWESYFQGYDATITQNIKSVSKSVLSALFGLAFDKAYLPQISVDPIQNLVSLPVSSFFPEFNVPQFVTLYRLMTMTAGLEIHGDPPAEFISSTDWSGWTLSQPPSQSHPLGTFNYTTCLTHVASEILTRATGMPTLDFAKKYLFEPLGISVTRWDHEPNPAGTYDGGWEMFMRPRDMARFGQLFLRNGRLEDGTQLISPAWVAASTRQLVPSPGYGLWWWMGGASTHGTPSQYYPGYYANGLGGQRIFILPSLDMVVVMTSRIPTQDTSAQAQDNHALLRYVLDAVVGKS